MPIACIVKIVGLYGVDHADGLRLHIWAGGRGPSLEDAMMQPSFARSALVLALSAGLLASHGVPVAHAQFGFPGLPSPRGVPLPGVRVPGVGVPGVGVPLPLPGLYGRNGLGRTLGIIGAVAVGAVILHKLSVNDRREVARRARVVVERDQDQRVVDSYRSKDGRHEVTMTAEPVQKASEFVDDPALQKMSEIKQDNVATAKGATKTQQQSEDEVIRLAELPPDSNCRKVTTEYESKVKTPPAKTQTKEAVSETKQSNVSIMCQTQAGAWKPAGA